LLQDILSGDEIIADTYDLKEIDDAVYEVDCKKIKKAGIDAKTLSSLTGGNAVDPNQKPSGAEDGGNDAAADEPATLEEEPTEQVNDVIDAFRLNQIAPYAKRQEFVEAIQGM